MRDFFRFLNGLVFCLLLGNLSVACATPKDFFNPWHQFTHPWFDPAPINHELPNQVLMALAQTDDGSLWIGSLNGLARYDGQHLYHYEASNLDGGLPTGRIRNLLALPDGRLLVGTNTAGLFLYSLNKDHFQPISLSTNDKTSVQRIYSLRHAQAGGIWVASEQGLHYLDLDNGISQLIERSTPSTAFSSSIFDVLEDHQGNLWLGANPGLWVRKAGESDFQAVDLGKENNDQIVWRLHQDQQRRIWAGTGSQGIFLFDNANPETPARQNPALQALIGHRTVRSFAENGNGTLWIGTEGRGAIQCFSLECPSPQAMTAGLSPNFSIASNTVFDTFMDASGVLWLATSRGLTRYLPPTAAVHVLGHPGRFIPALEQYPLSAMTVDRRQRLWLATDGDGIRVVDLEKGRIEHIPLPDIHADQRTLRLLEDTDGSLLVAGQSVLRIHPDTFAVQIAIPNLESYRLLYIDKIDDDILVGTHGDSALYSSKTGEYLASLWQHEADPAFGHLRQLRWSVQTGSQRWFATSNGLLLQSAPEQPFQVFLHDENQADSLPSNFISMLAYDAQRERLWLATDLGVVWLDLTASHAPARFHAVDKAGHHVTAIAMDSQGHVWASGDRRLLRIDSDDFSVQELGLKDGLRQGNFLDRAMHIGPRGELLVGNSAGLVVINPEKIQKLDNTPQPLQLSLVMAPGKNPPLPREGERLQLAQHQRSFHADFSLRDFRAPDEIRYSYRLLGFGDHWHAISSGTPASAVYTALPSGRFTLQLRATQLGDEQASITRDYPLTIAPYWHETTLARVLQGIAVLLAVMGLILIGRHWSLQRQRLLDQRVAERTRELDLANIKLEALTRTDTLTGLATRHHLMETTQRALAEAQAHHLPLSLLLLDLDHFKAINDRHGHLAGDAVLRAVARTVLSTCRDTDCAGRFGGEEILICLPNATLESAHVLAERLREKVQSLEIRFGDGYLPVTCSIGVSQLNGAEDSLASLFERADQAMYAAKRAGRNRVEKESVIPA